MKVIYARPPGRGWAPIAHLAKLAARLLGAELITLDASRLVSKQRKALAALPRRRRGDDVLLIAPTPGDLDRLLAPASILGGPRHVAAWVIDSWWTDRIPRSLGAARHVDHIYIAESADLSAWAVNSAAPVSWLPIGADVLGCVASTDRPITVQRVGRQPAEWDDDTSNQKALQKAGLRYQGRLDFGATDSEAHSELMRGLAHSRFVLAFSNAVSGAEYTHPTREYLTPRWMDALASGCVVAGIPPRSPGVAELLWDGALLDLGTTSRAAGISILIDADRGYLADVAERNRRKALRRLDWRHRIKTIAGDFGVRSELLDRELARIADQVDTLRQ